ncbi:MAG: hypothetical protein M1834_000536 [Cirrosporium novae-zelandiae]|nr:MAG: hypothetical protein M1834_000536 [Cirrosporium novae-zelandiae]
MFQEHTHILDFEMQNVPKTGASAWKHRESDIWYSAASLTMQLGQLNPANGKQLAVQSREAFHSGRTALLLRQPPTYGASDPAQITLVYAWESRRFVDVCYTQGLDKDLEGYTDTVGELYQQAFADEQQKLADAIHNPIPWETEPKGRSGRKAKRTLETAADTNDETAESSPAKRGRQSGGRKARS